MERCSSQEPEQEAKPAVGGITDQRVASSLEYVSLPESPTNGWQGPARGRQTDGGTATAAAAAVAVMPLPPPRTPEKRKLSTAMSPERSSAVLDRRTSAAANSGGMTTM